MPRPRRNILRLSLAAAGLLGLGVVTSVGVACACVLPRSRCLGPRGTGAYLAPMPSDVRSSELLAFVSDRLADTRFFSRAWTGFGAELRYVFDLRSEAGDLRFEVYPTSVRLLDGAGEPLKEVRRVEISPLPSRGALAVATHMMWAEVVVAGWPWWCIGRTTAIWDTGVKEFGVLYVGRRVLPRDAVWMGLAADTAFYAACWWMLLLVPRTIRRAHRRRRGRCIGCGYDRAGITTAAPCPECGVTPLTPA